MKTLIIIPAYNESEDIVSLINDIQSYGYDYLIINDNSTDSTEDVARSNGFNLLDLSVNVGLAGMTRTGFRYAYENGYDCVVNIDGDVHLPNILPVWWRKLKMAMTMWLAPDFFTGRSHLRLE